MDSKSAVSRKPTKKGLGSFINGGLQPSKPSKKTTSDEEQISRLQLRLTKGKVNQIDSAISERKIKIPRHLWLLEAIEEKLERDTKTTLK